MKHNYLKHLFTALLMLCATVATAHDFVVGGIYYKVVSSIDLTVEVTYRGNSYYSYSNEYSGEVTIPRFVNYNNKTYNVIRIGDYAFKDCRQLASVQISEGIRSIGSYSFEYCTNLSSITIPVSLEVVDYFAFSGIRHAYLNVYISSIEAWCGISFDMADSNPLYNNNNLYLNGVLVTDLVIPDGVKKIKKCAFSGYRKLKSVIIPNSVTEIGSSAFYYCLGLTSINIPEGVKSLDYHVFRDCSNLVSITFPSTLTSIGYEAFKGTKWYNDQHDGTVYAGTVLYGYKGEMPSNTSIRVKEGTKGIASRAFSDCTNLSSIFLPKGLSKIDSYAFSNCSGLQIVYCYAEQAPTVTNGALGSSIENATLYVPASALTNYQKTEPWNTFANIQTLESLSATIAVNEYGCATYCSPFALDFSNVEGLKAYSATGYKSYSQVVILTRVQTAEAGIGLFLKGEPGEYVVPVIGSTDEHSLNMLVGTLEPTIVNSTEGEMSNYKFTIADGDAAPMFYPFEDNTTFSAGKAYLQIPTAWLPATAQKSVSIRFDEGETTGIDELKGENGEVKTIYDLQGRVVENPTSGIYIIDGKKTLVK